MVHDLVKAHKSFQEAPCFWANLDKLFQKIYAPAKFHTTHHVMTSTQELTVQQEVGVQKYFGHRTS